MRLTLWHVVAVAVMTASPALVIAAPVPGTGTKSESPMNSARKALDEVGDMTYEARTLNDVIEDLKAKTKMPVILDSQIMNFGLDPNQPIVTVKLKQVKLKDGLKAALAPFNLKFGLTPEGLFISSEEGVITRQLRQRVSLHCDGTEFAATIKQLAADTGANVVVDPRLGEMAKRAVTLKLDDVPLETAVRLLAEVADLRAVRSSNVLFITTPEKARDFRDDGPTSPSPLNPFFPIGGPGIGIGGVAFPAVPLPANPPPGGVEVVPGGGAAVPPPLPPVADKPVANPPVPPVPPVAKPPVATPPAPPPG